MSKIVDGVLREEIFKKISLVYYLIGKSFITIVYYVFVIILIYSWNSI